MKKMRQLRRTEGLFVRDASIHGGYGAVIVGKWSGSVVWGTDEDGWEHVSVSPYDHTITPSWDDMCKLKDMFFEDEETVIQIHPPKSRYVNIMKNCLHLRRPKDPAILKALDEVTVG